MRANDKKMSYREGRKIPKSKRVSSKRGDVAERCTSNQTDLELYANVERSPKVGQEYQGRDVNPIFQSPKYRSGKSREGEKSPSPRD